MNKEASYYKVINWFLINDNFRKVILKKTTVKWVGWFIENMGSNWCKDKRSRKTTKEMVQNKLPSYTEGNFNQILVA